MNLEQFKLLTEKQRIEYGKTIPLRYTCDSNNNELSYKNSDGFWSERTYNSNNNELTYKDSDGFWSERTYNSNNNELTFKNSNDYWMESTYDSNNNELTFKNSDGASRIVLIKGENFTLWYVINSKKYIAGCKNLSYKECLAYYKESKDTFDDAELFMKTIKEHHKTVAIVL